MPNYLQGQRRLAVLFRQGPRLGAARRRSPSSTGRRSDGFKNTKEALESYRAIAEMIGDFVSAEIAPYAMEIDQRDIEFTDGEAVFPPRRWRRSSTASAA